jgi:uncharacterized coiled-coil protein SlyX
MNQPPQVNKDYVINSLTNQIASLSQANAIKDAIITEQQAENKQLKDTLEKLENKMTEVKPA